MFVSRYVRAAAAGAAALAFASAIGGCRSVATNAAEDVQRQHTASPAVRTAASKAAATPSVAASPTRPCATSDLSITPVQRHETEGVQVERFTVATTSPAGCTLSGEPNLVPRGPLSAQVPGATVDLALSQQDFPDDLDIQPPPTRTIPVTPAKPASFYLAWFSASPVVCVQSNGFGFNAPGDTTYLDMRALSYAIGPVCDGIFYVSAAF